MNHPIINIDAFARQLITDRCSTLIETQGLLPSNVLNIVKNARDQFFEDPSDKNYEYIKKLFSQTKYVDDAVDYKDFNRRLLLIFFKFALNKSKVYFENYKSLIDVALKRLDGINPDLKSSPKAMLQHYNECLENLDNPRNDEHHLITFSKEIATKIFIETIDLYSYNNKSPFETGAAAPATPGLFAATITNNRLKRARVDAKPQPKPCAPQPKPCAPQPNARPYTVVSPIFSM
ncbi:ORF115 [Lymantria xylina nucleopolyhedrovirus]|uniref:ORF115 n=1 Tax=Lymantria xylina multiple nucleopolyhedrovirus TaxID=2847840 RepID=D4N2F2_9ABAC|nr:ORF115 [Lymantria xylina nucleopolyhedrovirus]ADD73824.1 ORF115 [Lymantria xylina nucleopolyhedrovirus]